jgi:hypothetical protein
LHQHAQHVRASISPQTRAWKTKLPTAPPKTPTSETTFAIPAFFVGVAVALAAALVAEEAVVAVVVAVLDAEDAAFDVVATALT